MPTSSTNVGSTPCKLEGVPTITILSADGTALPVRQKPAAQQTLRTFVLTTQGDTAWLT